MWRIGSMGRTAIVLTLLGATVFIGYYAPRPSPAARATPWQWHAPDAAGEWTERSVTQQLDLQDSRYRFASQLVADTYTTPQGDELLFLVINVDNFHPPKACFTAAGFQTEELPPVRLVVGRTSIPATALIARRADEAFVVLYWACVEGRLTADLTKADFVQLVSNLLGKRRSGVMTRLDVRLPPGSGPEHGVFTAQRFLTALIPQIPRTAISAVFGQETLATGFPLIELRPDEGLQLGGDLFPIK